MGARWEPLSTTNLETGLPYSEPAAWEVIATSLEDMSVEIRALTLRSPPGAIGYESSDDLEFILVRQDPDRSDRTFRARSKLSYRRI